MLSRIRYAEKIRVSLVALTPQSYHVLEQACQVLTPKKEGHYKKSTALKSGSKHGKALFARAHNTISRTSCLFVTSH